MGSYEWRVGDEEGPKRTFDPLLSAAHYAIPEDELMVYDPAKGVQHLRHMNPRTCWMGVNRHTVVMSIGGACRGNGTPSARASWSVFFRPSISV